ncbi:MAG: hypothetical protein ACREQL_01870, partial [Candidatus Binatia bacterium]
MVATTARPTARAVVATALVLALALDVGAPPTERRRLPIADDLPPVYEAVRRMPEPVLYERTNGVEGAALAMYHAIFHGKRLVNGYSGFTSPGPAFVTQRLFDFPARGAVALLDRLGVQAVLLHEPDEAALDRRIAQIPPGTSETVFRDRNVALLRVRGAPPEPSRAVVPVERVAWHLEANAGAAMLPSLHDGDPRTVWRIVAERSTPPSVVVDLDRVVVVAGVRCIPGAPDAPGIYLADVSTSLDDATWTPTDARFEPDALQALFDHPAGVRSWEAHFAPRDARYVRLTNPRLAFWGGAWEIAELDVLTPAEGSTP